MPLPIFQFGEVIETDSWVLSSYILEVKCALYGAGRPIGALNDPLRG